MNIYSHITMITIVTTTTSMKSLMNMVLNHSTKQTKTRTIMFHGICAQLFTTHLGTLLPRSMMTPRKSLQRLSTKVIQLVPRLKKLNAQDHLHNLPWTLKSSNLSLRKISELNNHLSKLQWWMVYTQQLVTTKSGKSIVIFEQLVSTARSFFKKLRRLVHAISTSLKKTLPTF